MKGSRRFWSAWLLWAATLGTMPVATVAVAADDEGWTALFNGKDLSGWEQKNGTATYRIEEGAVVGKTNEGSPNSFLCTTKDYCDFELTLEIKVDDPLNAGVQIRSKSLPEKDNGRVHGPQVEVATNGTAGFVYGEALGTGWLSEDRSDPKATAAFKPGEWNTTASSPGGTTSTPGSMACPSPT